MSHTTPALLSKSTPVLAVAAIEPALAFWARLGLEQTVGVPEQHERPDSRLGFAILAGHGVELMYQTTRSIEADLAAAASDRAAFASGAQQGYLFVKVPDLDAVCARLEGESVVMPRRTTFYGATELGYSDRAGNIVVFAQMED